MIVFKKIGFAWCLWLVGCRLCYNSFSYHSSIVLFPNTCWFTYMLPIYQYKLIILQYGGHLSTVIICILNSSINELKHLLKTIWYMLCFQQLLVRVSIFLWNYPSFPSLVMTVWSLSLAKLPTLSQLLAIACSRKPVCSWLRHWYYPHSSNSRSLAGEDTSRE